jgi:2-iminobutanoate/2-iminopropanoate deaminase
MTIERIGGPAGATYSDAVVVAGAGGRTIHVSGQLPVDAEGNPVEGDLGEQARACFDAIERVLGRCGAGLGDVVRITAFLTQLDDYRAYSAARARAFGDRLPASASVQVAGLLGGALVEVDAVAWVVDG